MNYFFLNDIVYFFHIHYKCISFEDDFGYFCEPDRSLNNQEFNDLYLLDEEEDKINKCTTPKQAPKTANTEQRQLTFTLNQPIINPNTDNHSPSNSNLYSLSCVYNFLISLGFDVHLILQYVYRKNQLN